MGGDTSSCLSFKHEEDSSSDMDFHQSSSCSACYLRDHLVFKNGDNDLKGNAPDNHANSLNYAADQRKREKAYKEVLHSYDQLLERVQGLKDAKSKILSYTPGAWIEKAGGVELNDYVVPKTTSIILIGPKGSGKSSLVNRISKVFEDDQFSPDRAQVSYNSSSEKGTFFLHEYMIPRGSTSFCLYDTRGLSPSSSDNINAIKHWITRGVRHGELVLWGSDGSKLRDLLKQKACGYGCQFGEIRKVNYVIFVVNGVEVLKSMEGDNDAEGCYTQMIATAFNCPYLSFKDDKPALVITHGDLLARNERANIRVYLGELLGIPPDRQIFDIPENCDPSTQLTIVDLLRYSLEHADKNLKILPQRNWMINKVLRVILSPSTLLSFLVTLGIALCLGYYIRNADRHHVPKPELSVPQVDWSTIRHMWLDSE